MSVLLIIVPAVAAALLAYALTPATRVLALRIGAIDVPAPRKVHDKPIPRLGGLAVILAIAVVQGTLALVMPPHSHIIAANLFQATAIGLFPIAAVSLIDDIRTLRALPRLIVHIAGASATVALGVHLGSNIHLFGFVVHLGWLAFPISVVWLAGMANAFNFIDGLDGLSAGLALISSLALAGVSIVVARYEMAATALVLAGAIAGFLPFNLHPAKVYLGDTGATAIGFFLGVLTLAGGSTATAGLAVILPLLVVGVPLADTILSIARRIVKKIEGTGNGVMEADRGHIHHRLLALGFTHQRAVRLLYGVGIAAAIIGFGSVFVSQKNAALLLTAMLAAAVVGVIKLHYDEFAFIRSGTALRFYNWPVLRKGFFVVFADFAIVICAIYTTIVLKYDDWNIHDHRALALDLLVLGPVATVIAFGAMGIYHRAWSKANLDDILRLSAAMLISCALTTVILRLFSESVAALTFFALYTIVGLGFMNGSRISYRVLLHWMRRANQHGDSIVIYGAGQAGTLALTEILINDAIDMVPIGFIDDDPLKQGRVLNGVPVLGDLTILEKVILDREVKGVVVASHKIPNQNVRSARTVCRRNGAWLFVFEVNFRRSDGTPPPRAPEYEMSGVWQ